MLLEDWKIIDYPVFLLPYIHSDWTNQPKAPCETLLPKSIPYLHEMSIFWLSPCAKHRRFLVDKRTNFNLIFFWQFNSMKYNNSQQNGLWKMMTYYQPISLDCGQFLIASFLPCIQPLMQIWVDCRVSKLKMKTHCIITCKGASVTKTLELEL